jgi:hypothetical protein
MKKLETTRFRMLPRSRPKIRVPICWIGTNAFDVEITILRRRNLEWVGTAWLSEKTGQDSAVSLRFAWRGRPEEIASS